MLNKNKKNFFFKIERIYTKDVSFESPNSPKIFKKKWNPKIQIDLDTNSYKLYENFYEVILKIKLIAKTEEIIAFICEIQKAGIFNISGIDKKQISYYLGSYCPNIIFPYIRESISNQIINGSFPPLNINPINFDHLFIEHNKINNK
ncbi:protein-export chaperone SecB [Sodalis-like secondary symbiont of Drepanosiphum platanoidis]|uniref:protein-export chaperone SecB n=1 Tax=Sodalis-like secondary symbiont of Drepanosiphum platanoidis TaxID=2994493 RepID=UPI003463AA9F